jgi:hypothetical protein
VLNIQGVTPILNVSNLAETFAWFERLGWRKQPWDNHAGSTWVSWWLESPAAVVRECHIRHPDGHTFRVGARLEGE